jgi:hypothetical protein
MEEIAMPLYAPPPTPIEVPKGIDHYEFFSALLGKGELPEGMRKRVRFQPPREEDLPLDAPEWMWWCVFAAARAMVARRTPHLLQLWDIRSGQLTSALINDPEEWEEEVDNTCLDALKDLLLIMVDPEAAKPGLKGTTFVQIFEDAKKAFTHCKRLRERIGRQGRYESRRKRPDPDLPIPQTPIPTDSPQFYRLALQEVLGTGQDCRHTYQGQPFNADHIKDHHLRKCLPEWKRPGQAALTLLSEVTGNSVPYLAQMISRRKQAAKARLKRVPPPSAYFTE